MDFNILWSYKAIPIPQYVYIHVCLHYLINYIIKEVALFRWAPVLSQLLLPVGYLYHIIYAILTNFITLNFAMKSCARSVRL